MTQANTSQDKQPVWWEFYVIRYSMGTIIGAAIFFYICKTDPDLSLLLLFPATTSLDYYHYFLLAFYGLTFCYIASAPILVLHASRFLFTFSPKKKAPHFKKALYGALLALTLFGYYKIISPSPEQAIPFLVFPLAIFLFIFQIKLILDIFSNTNDLYDFYKKLSENRANLKGDLKESYKNLREHGNSFGIVVLELFLGACLISIKSSPLLAINDSHSFAFALLIFIWVLPASMIWMVGTAIERRVSDYKI